MTGELLVQRAGAGLQIVLGIGGKRGRHGDGQPQSPGGKPGGPHEIKQSTTARRLALLPSDLLSAPKPPPPQKKKKKKKNRPAASSTTCEQTRRWAGHTRRQTLK